MSIVKKYFGSLAGNTDVFSYILKNKNGMEAEIIDYGGTITNIRVPDRYGRISDIVLGYDSLSDYVEADGYQGAIIGRVGNRIGNGRFSLDGREYSLYLNSGNNHLHGGKSGFNDKMWDVISAEDTDEPVLKLFLFSKDGEEGYPGALSVTVTYQLTNDNGLSIRYEAQTDKKTILNLTNHTYFNLGGYASGKIYDHVLWTDSDSYIKTDDALIPTGEILSVDSTPFDFRTPKKIGCDIGKIGGYDVCLNFTGGETKEPVKRITVKENSCGRVMDVYTNQPCVQFYSANFLTDEKHPFKGGYKQEPQTAFCLETQHMPDSINHKSFTDITLDVNEKYDYTTVYKFSVE